ncbi:MAG: PHP domain-containing protein, partial [Erysipelotrichaceae bacterium]|nr:PHP domain-containing protein [Erysipelotrichaceae bacterium]
MKFNLEELFSRYEYNNTEKACFSGFKIVDALYKKSKDLVTIRIENDEILPCRLYNDVIDYFRSYGFSNLKIYFKVRNDDLSVKEIAHYVNEYKSIYNTFKDGIIVRNNDGFAISYVDEEAYQKDSEYLDDLKLYFYNLGYRKDITLKLNGIRNEEPEVMEALPEKKVTEEAKENKAPKKNYYRTSKTYTDIKIDDLVDTLYSVKFTGKIFKVDERTTKTGSLAQTIYVMDEDNACIVKVVEGRRFSKEDLKNNTAGKWANFYGNYRFDNFNNDYIFEPDAIEFIDDPDPLTDDEKEKRVELHAHTKLSEMDGVSSPKELVSAAYQMGHKAVAITDHQCVQGFHEAFMKYNELAKANKENFDFKVLYGCEFNMVYPDLNIVYNCKEGILADEEYVVFDLET